MPEPITIAVATGLASAVNAAVTFARFAYEIKATPTDVKTCLDLVCRVDEDIQFAINLRAQHLKQLSTNPETLRRLDRIIKQASESIIDVGRLLEGCRKEAHGGKVPLQGRMKWILGDSMAFSRRTANLQQQHAAINVEIAYMRQMEALKPLRDLTASTTFENTELLSMSRKRSSSKLSAFSDSDAPPPAYSCLTPRPSMMFDPTSSYPSPPEPGFASNTEPEPAISHSLTPRQSMYFDEKIQPHQRVPESNPETSLNWNDLATSQEKLREWEPEPNHVAQNWNPIGGVPHSLIPGNCEIRDIKEPQNSNKSIRSPPRFTSPSWESTNIEAPQSFNEAPASTEWETCYPTYSRPHNLSIGSLESSHPPAWELPTISHSRTWDTAASWGIESNASIQNLSGNSNSISWETSYPSPPIIPPKIVEQQIWELPANSQRPKYDEGLIPQSTISEPEHEHRNPPPNRTSFNSPQIHTPFSSGSSTSSPPQVWNPVSTPGPYTYGALESTMQLPDRSASVVSSLSGTSEKWDVPTFHTSHTSNSSAMLPRSLTSGTWGSNQSANHDLRIDESLEDEDPEAAFYRDLRLQEEERQRRRAARMTR